MSETKKGFLCRQEDKSQCSKRLRHSGPNPPEDIWCHIHSLLPMRDAACAACVSRVFLHSWKRHPNLILTKETLGVKQNACGNGDTARAFTGKVDQILKNHSGTGVKTLKLDIFDCRDLNPSYLNIWLQIGITPGIENVTLTLPLKYKDRYNFPCSLLSGANGSSIRHLHLTNCAFRPTIGTACLNSLAKLYLHEVRITREELGCLLYNSFALKELKLKRCNEIICLKIPCMLHLSRLTVSECSMLQMIDIKAPNISIFNFSGDMVQLSLVQSLNLKNLNMECSSESNFLCHAITKFPYIVPNLETLTLSSICERVDTPMVAAKFPHVKRLEIYLDVDYSPGYDYLSLVSFIEASPVLETFILAVQQDDMNFVSVFEDASNMRQMPEHKHDSLKNVTILGFCSAKSMVELTCHILENATSLECIILDSVFDGEDEDNLGRCSVASGRKTGECFPQSSQVILEASNALMAIERYILEKAPSTVKLDVRGPCSRCHT